MYYSVFCGYAICICKHNSNIIILLLCKDYKTCNIILNYIFSSLYVKYNNVQDNKYTCTVYSI